MAVAAQPETKVAEPGLTFTPPANGLLRWLADPGRNVPPPIRDVLLVELFSSVSAVVSGLLNVLILNLMAIWLSRLPEFRFILAANILICALRLTVIGRVIAARRDGSLAPTGLYLVTGMLWCGLQGVLAFTALWSGNATLQILATCTAMALIGPICARNYPAPRYAMTLCMLCDLPFVAGAIASGNHWLLVLVPMTPFYLQGSHVTIARFQRLAIETLQSRHESLIQARQDPLTGLLNRNGLLETLHAGAGQNLPRLTLFYLDLDGFKQVNDSFGHQAGDMLLREVAKRIADGVRAGDIAARMGGDEFVVIAPDMPPQEAESFAARLIGLVKAPYDLPGIGAPRIGVSIGFACAPDDGSGLEDLYRLADAALYEVKTFSKGGLRRAAVAA